MEQEQKTITVAGVIVLAAVIVAGLLVYFGDSQNGDREIKVGGGLDIIDVPVIGDMDAPVTIVEFADFQCVACAQFAETIMPQIKSQYIDTGKVKLAAKTLTFIDSYDKSGKSVESFLSAMAFECANEQGKAREIQEKIYAAEIAERKKGTSPENSGNLNTLFFFSTARELGLSESQFSSCVNSVKYADRLTRYLNDAQTAMSGKVATPAVFINGKMISGVRQFSEYRTVIEKALEEAIGDR